MLRREFLYRMANVKFYRYTTTSDMYNHNLDRTKGSISFVDGAGIYINHSDQQYPYLVANVFSDLSANMYNLRVYGGSGSDKGLLTVRNGSEFSCDISSSALYLENEYDGTFLLLGNEQTVGSGRYVTNGFGVAELWEWEDGNVNSEDRRGYFVTLEGQKIRIATPEDKFILGVIDPHSMILGNAATGSWHKKYLTDVFGEYIYEEVTVPEEIDEEGNVISPSYLKKVRVLNPDYDDSLSYRGRLRRKEYSPICSKGILTVIDDGSCKVNSFATVGEGGIATHSDTNYKVRVLKRLDDTHVLVYIDGVFTI